MNNKVKVQLYSKENRGKSPKSRFGVINFDKDGFAIIEVAADQMEALQGTGLVLKVLEGEEALAQQESEKVPDMVSREDFLTLRSGYVRMEADLEKALGDAKSLRERLVKRDQEVAALEAENKALLSRLQETSEDASESVQEPQEGEEEVDAQIDQEMEAAEAEEVSEEAPKKKVKKVKKGSKK
jgi:hypothetical protein